MKIGKKMMEVVMNMMELLEKMMIDVIGSTVRTANQQVANHTQHINETFPQRIVL
jgi:hypothetical protein